MNARVKRRWVRALRGGEYEQGRTGLCQVRGRGYYCCLGVLMDEAAPEFFPDAPSPVGWRRVVARGKTASLGFIPDDLAIMWGLSMMDQGILANLNDRGSSFSRIADWIEENL